MWLLHFDLHGTGLIGHRGLVPPTEIFPRTFLTDLFSILITVSGVGRGFANACGLTLVSAVWFIPWKDSK